MRNGMSVKEIYDALDRLKRLEKAYGEKQAECDRLSSIIQESIDYNVTTATTYQRVATSADNLTDKFEFLSKAAGLLEATIIIRGLLKSKNGGTDVPNEETDVRC